jgi:hypothetical protein
LIEIGDADGLTKTILAVLRESEKQKTSKPDDWSNIDAVIRIYEQLLNKEMASQNASINKPQSVIRNS